MKKKQNKHVMFQPKQDKHDHDEQAQTITINVIVNEAQKEEKDDAVSSCFKMLLGCFK